MNGISDETLMAFADKRLDSATYERIAQALETDTEARRRLEAFVVTGRHLSQLFEAFDRAPIPQHLLDTIQTAPMGEVKQASKPAATERVRQRLLSRISEMLGLEGWTGALALAFSAVLLIGTASIWRLGTSGPIGAQSPVVTRLDDGRLMASTQLAAALETAGSGTALALDAAAAGTRFKPVFSFAAKSGAFCRQYEVQQSDGTGLLGVGCREADGQWSIRAETRVIASDDTASGTFVPAGPADEEGRALIDKTVDALIGEGSVIAGEEEARIIKNGWKRPQAQ